MSKFVRLTDRYITSSLMPAPPGKLTEVRDTICNGLAIRSSDNGRHSYIVHGRVKGLGKGTRYTIGKVGVIPLAAAREEARRVLGEMALGRQPMTQARAQREAEREAIEAERVAKQAAKVEAANRFEQVARDYFVLHLRAIENGDFKRRSHAAIEADIERVWIKAWGDRSITSIKRADVIKIIVGMVDSKRPAAARCAFSHLRRLFNWAITRDRLGDTETSPCDRIKIDELCGGKRSRDRDLEDDEMRAVWEAASAVGHPWGDLVKMLLLTGLRLREAANATHDEINLDAGTLTIPLERMKSKRKHRIPLTRALLALIETFPRRGQRDRLFTVESGRAVSDFMRGKRRIDAAVAKIADKPVEHWVFHDLRRTVRTNFSRLRDGSGKPLPGVTDVVRELAIAHRPGGVRGVYDRYDYAEELVTLFDAWAARLSGIVGGNVVTLPVRRT